MSINKVTYKFPNDISKFLLKTCARQGVEFKREVLYNWKLKYEERFLPVSKSTLRKGAYHHVGMRVGKPRPDMRASKHIKYNAGL